MYLTTQGLVLRVSPYNETDAMLTILTARHGKISAKARGLRRKNSPLIAPCQLLSFSEFTSVYSGTLEEAFNEYMLHGGMPLSLVYKTDDEKEDYLKNLFQMT